MDKWRVPTITCNAGVKLLCENCPEQPECGIYEDKEGFCITEKAEGNRLSG